MTQDVAQDTETDASKPKVIPLSSKPKAEAVGSVTTVRPRQKRRRILTLSFILCVLLPSALGSYYFAVIASDRYAATAGFAVRGVNAGAGIDGIGALTGLASAGSTTSDSYIVLKYLRSRDIVERLQSDMDIRSAFTNPEIDPLSRMGKALSIEEVVRYWGRMIRTSFDSTSGIVTVEVQAYSADQAEQIATLVLRYTDELVNALSVSARRDSVRFAEAEVTRAEERLRTTLQQIRDFREQESSINPAASAQLDIELVGGLESRLIDLRARIASIEGALDDDAPSLRALRNQAEAIEDQIAARQAAISGDAPRAATETAAMSGLLATFETLVVEKEFAQQVYQSALTSLEQARTDADRQQRYLAVFTLPAKPEQAMYPKRLQNILLVIAIAVSVWGIGTLIVYSVRDHLS
ncbi:hypothetical protein [Yoonia sp. BS5-3]|uniref:Capsular polysaccharide transport system permease protein n=1 Tax=Yoonia phaeophyticola TaxID=3137369 RepID=A0ABZ2V8K5_9RHOB